MMDVLLCGYNVLRRFGFLSVVLGQHALKIVRIDFFRSQMVNCRIAGTAGEIGSRVTFPLNRLFSQAQKNILHQVTGNITPPHPTPDLPFQTFMLCEV